MGWEGRWEGGLGWGTHVHPWLIHLNVLQNPLQYFKVISLQLKLINLQKKISESQNLKCSSEFLVEDLILKKSPGDPVKKS